MCADKRAILVVGPESSGTRLAAEILISGGCAGESAHRQSFDERLPDDAPLIVWRRSMPHAGGWPVLPTMIEELRALGYSVSGVVTMRDQFAMECSQVARQHALDTDTAGRNMQEALYRTTKALFECNVPFVVLSYDNLVAHPEKVQEWLAIRLKLPRVPRVKIRDMNARYYRRVTLD